MSTSNIDPQHADPVAPIADRAIAHLNNDHADAVLAWAQAFADAPTAEAAEVASVDMRGADLFVQVGDEARRRVRVTWLAPLDGPDALRPATVELTRAARERLDAAGSAGAAHTDGT